MCLPGGCCQLTFSLATTFVAGGLCGSRLHGGDCGGVVELTARSRFAELIK